MGGTPLGAPLVGWVVDRFGARWALGVGALSGVAAAAVAVRYLVRHRGLRLSRDAGRLRVMIEAAPLDETDVRVAAGERSEEHTSELQSLMRISYAVFCLKKKTRQLEQ